MLMQINIICVEIANILCSYCCSILVKADIGLIILNLDFRTGAQVVSVMVVRISLNIFVKQNRVKSSRSSGTPVL